MYGILQFRIMKAEEQAILDNVNVTTTQNAVLKKAEDAYKAYSADQEKKYADYTKKITSILPPDENYTDLTRQLDEYFDLQDKPGSPIFQSSLRFGKGAPVQGMAYISALPISMNLESSRENFYKFLEFIDKSGSLETGTRLMEIKSVQINFPEGGEVVEDSTQKVNFNVELISYYQTPKVAR